MKTYRLSKASTMTDVEPSFNRAGYSLRGLERYDNGGSENVRSVRSVRMSILEEQAWQKHIEGHCDPNALSNLACALSLPLRATARKRGLMDAEELSIGHISSLLYSCEEEIQNENISSTHHQVQHITASQPDSKIPKAKKQKQVTFDRDINSCKSFISGDSNF